ncbi:hypothetical protein BDW22DRAFT_440943 [Trametopsis cervina]|nr:hypothetical protein BDW22DRAFT_440943 [Trametopsis cervina]
MSVGPVPSGPARSLPALSAQPTTRTNNACRPARAQPNKKRKTNALKLPPARQTFRSDFDVRFSPPHAGCGCGEALFVCVLSEAGRNVRRGDRGRIGWVVRTNWMRLGEDEFDRVTRALRSVPHRPPPSRGRAARSSRAYCIRGTSGCCRPCRCDVVNYACRLLNIPKSDVSAIRLGCRRKREECPLLTNKAREGREGREGGECGEDWGTDGRTNRGESIRPDRRNPPLPSISPLPSKRFPFSLCHPALPGRVGRKGGKRAAMGGQAGMGDKTRCDLEIGCVMRCFAGARFPIVGRLLLL